MCMHIDKPWSNYEAFCIHGLGFVGDILADLFNLAVGYQNIANIIELISRVYHSSVLYQIYAHL